jgi:integrase
MKTEQRMRGDGRLFLRGATWWMQFYVDGRQHRESTKASDPEKAEKVLRARLKEVHAHELDPARSFVSQHDKRRTVADLMDALKTDFEIRGKASPQNLSNICRVRADFGHYRAASLTAERIDEYIRKRLRPDDSLTAPSAPASINRVTQLLGQAYKLAELPAPRIRRLSEVGNERQGFFSEQEIRRVIANLRSELADFALFGWLTGMRKSEIASLAWADVDGDVIRLRAENSKNGVARMIPLEGELGELVARRQAAKQVEINGTTMLCSFIFHRQGEPIGDFRKAWETASRKAGIRRLFHDLRRSACRNMVQAGVAQTIAMRISGHATDSMFRRYAISAENDLRTALRKTQEHLRTVQENVVSMPKPPQGATAPTGTSRGQSAQAVAQVAGK